MADPFTTALDAVVPVTPLTTDISDCHAGHYLACGHLTQRSWSPGDHMSVVLDTVANLDGGSCNVDAARGSK